MEDGKIIILKLFNGELIIGTKDKTEQVFNVVLKNPRQIAMVPTMSGSVNVVMGSVCAPFKVKRLQEEISIPMNQVMLTINEDEIDNELINGYKSEISGIKIASAADAASLKSVGADGDFTL